MKQTLATTKWILGLYFKNYPLYTTIFIICEVILNLGSLLNAYVIALVTDMAISLTTSSLELSFSNFIPIVGLIVGSYLFIAIVKIVDTYDIKRELEAFGI